MTTALVNTDGRIWSTTHSGLVFHAFRLDENGKPVALCRKNVRPRSHTTIHDDWTTEAQIEGYVTGRCERCVVKLDELTAAATAAPADEDEPLPQPVQDAVPGELVVLPDADKAGRTIVWRDREHAGVIDDEGPTMTRGRYAAWSPRAERRDGVVGFFPSVEAATAAIKALWSPADAEPAVFFVEIDRHVQARPRVYEDRYRIHQRGLADPVDGFAVPYRGDRNDRTTLALRGWQIVGEIEYVAGLNVSRARVERTPVEYGNSGHWISAHVVDPDADRPHEHRYVAVAKCGAHLIETCDTPRGHALCVACTGDPVEVNYLRDREGWLKDGGRPVKVLRALSYHDRIIASMVTTDVKGSEREWYDVRADARASEIDFAPETDARPGLRQTCLNALCTKDYGHTLRDGDECGNVFTKAGGGGQRPTHVASLDGPRVGERVKYAVGRHTVHATVTRLVNDAGKVSVVDDGDQTGTVRPVDPTLLTVQTPDLDSLHGVALEENRLRDALLAATASEAPEPRRTVTDEPAAGTLVDPHTWLRRPAEPCKHGVRRRSDATLTIRCEFGSEYGVFGDEGPIYRADCAVQAANEAARYTVEDDGDTTYEVAIICPDHDEQRAATCEDCYAEPDA